MDFLNRALYILFMLAFAVIVGNGCVRDDGNGNEAESKAAIPQQTANEPVAALYDAIEKEAAYVSRLPVQTYIDDHKDFALAEDGYGFWLYEKEVAGSVSTIRVSANESGQVCFILWTSELFAEYYDLQDASSYETIRQLVDANEGSQTTVNLGDGIDGKAIESTIVVDDSCQVILTEFDHENRETRFWFDITFSAFGSQQSN